MTVYRFLHLIGLRRLACAIRGYHNGLAALGTCLSCGKRHRDRRPVAPPSIVREFHPITFIAANDEAGKKAAFVRNDAIREAARWN